MGLFLFSPLKAQEFELGDKIDIKVVGSVTYNQNEGYYEYTLFSSKKSEQNLWDFRVILSDEKLIKSIQAPQGWYEPCVAPRGLGVLPSWQEVAWVAWGAPDEVEIRPGSSASGFKFTSLSSLPGIVDYYAEGWHEIPSFPYGMAPDYVPGYNDFTPYGPGTVGKTIGPVPLPKVFNPISFIGTLTSLKEECYSLGWIDNEGILNSLNKKLDNAKKNLEKGNIKTAKNILNAFINEVEAQKGKHLSPEAYAVLKFNAQYLIDNL